MTLASAPKDGSLSPLASKGCLGFDALDGFLVNAKYDSELFLFYHGVFWLADLLSHPLRL